MTKRAQANPDDSVSLIHLSGMMWLGVLINYVDRVNISHALPVISREFGFSPTVEGIILSAFSWGYVACMLPGGMYVDRVGPVKAAGSAGHAWSIVTVVTGLSVSSGMLVASRLLLGAAEAPIFPANARLVRERFRAHSRGFAIALFDSGSYLGTALSAPLVVMLIVLGGWRSAFIVCGVLGIGWALLWSRLAGRERASFERKATPLTTSQIWRLIRDRRVAGTCVAFFSYNYCKSFFLTWMPLYLIRDRGVQFSAIGLLGAVPPMAAIGGSLAGGWVTDMMLRKGYPLKESRKIPLMGALCGAACVGLLPVMRSDMLAIAVLSVAFASTASAAAVLWSAPSDFSHSPATVGTLGGLQNTISNTAGMLAPLATGFLVQRSGSFNHALLVYAGVALVGAMVYWLLVDRIEPLQQSLTQQRGQAPLSESKRNES